MFHQLPRIFDRFTSQRLATTAWLLIVISSLLSGCTSYGPRPPVQEATLTLSTNSLNFYTVVVGHTGNHTLHVSNTGTAPLSITKLSLSNKEFVISGPSVPRVILPNMGLDYTLAFTPTTAGNAAAALTIESNATNSSTSVSLAGVAEKVIATVQVSPSSLNFGNMNLQTTGTKNVTLQNTGDINITISGITVAGSGFGYADLSPGFSLAPSQSVTFQVWFRPKVKGAASGTVSILSANLSSPASLALAGDGVAAGTPPPPPPPGQHTVRLSWNPSSSAVAGYRVYRSESANGGFQDISASLLSSTSYDDATVVSGSTYFYAVTAVDSAGVESPYSNEATAAVPTP